jgi:hypothetical protein
VLPEPDVYFGAHRRYERGFVTASMTRQDGISILMRLRVGVAQLARNVCTSASGSRRARRMSLDILLELIEAYRTSPGQAADRLERVHRAAQLRLALALSAEQGVLFRLRSGFPRPFDASARTSPFNSAGWMRGR